MNYYRKPIEKTVNDVKLKMQIGALTVKINDLLEVDKNIKKDVADNSNSIKNIKNEIDLKLSDKVDKSNIDNLLSDNYYNKTNINLKFSDLYNKEYIDSKLRNIYDKTYVNNLSNNLYNRTYLDNKFDNIYDKTEINCISSKLNRNIVLFNTNLTNHINKYATDKQGLKEDIKDNKTKLDKFSYYIKEFFMHNIDLVRRFEITSEIDYIQILQFEIDRNFLVDDVIKFFISIKLLYENIQIQIQIQILGQSRRLVGPRPILALPIYHSFVPGLTVACSEG